MRPERGRDLPKVTRQLQGQEDGRPELSLLLPSQLSLGSLQAGNSFSICSYFLKAILSKGHDQLIVNLYVYVGVELNCFFISILLS